ncbi:MAG: hypothetical protein PUC29_02750, partial [Clostridia bacterium]|nr:hypothetical protein [Clostridia bacterium]
YALALCVLLAGSIGVTLAVKGLLTLPAVASRFATSSQRTILNDLVKVPVDCILYIVSYKVQKKLIFKAD